MMERQNKVKRTFKISGWILVVIVILAVMGWLISSRKILPPTTMQGHTETSPAAHILKESMDYRTQQHMLEHADGTGPAGVIINYNCEDFNCASDLIERLTRIVEEYPTFVYLAPFAKMDAKIALTKLDKIEILEEYNEERIRNFITNK